MEHQQPTEIVEAEGHLIDSQLLNVIFDKVIERQSRFEVLQFDIGRTNDEFSHLKLQITSPDDATLRELVEDLMALGCHPLPEREAALRIADSAYVLENGRIALEGPGPALLTDSKVQAAYLGARARVPAGDPAQFREPPS